MSTANAVTLIAAFRVLFILPLALLAMGRVRERRRRADEGLSRVWRSGGHDEDARLRKGGAGHQRLENP